MNSVIKASGLLVNLEQRLEKGTPPGLVHTSGFCCCCGGRVMNAMGMVNSHGILPYEWYFYRSMDGWIR